MLTRAHMDPLAEMHQEARKILQVTEEAVLVLGGIIRDARLCIGQCAVETLPRHSARSPCTAASGPVR